jgi:hypothetical protein
MGRCAGRRVGQSKRRAAAANRQRLAAAKRHPVAVSLPGPDPPWSDPTTGAIVRERYPVPREEPRRFP